MSERVEGNSCLFSILQVTNLLLVAVGLAVTALGIYAVVQSKAFDWYSGTFVVFGAVMSLVALFGYKNRRHAKLMTLYLLLVLCILTCLTGLTIGIICYPQYASKVGGEQHANAIRYTLLGFCAVALLCLLFGCWYRGSLRDALFDYENAPTDKFRPLTTPKTDKAREAMNEKYPQLKELRDRKNSEK